MKKQKFLIVLIGLVVFGAAVFLFWKYYPKSSADYCNFPFQLSCSQFGWDENIQHNDPTCTEDTIYWSLKYNSLTQKYASSGKVYNNSFQEPIDLMSNSLIKYISVGLARPIFMPAGTSVKLKLCAGQTKEEAAGMTNCATFVPSKKQFLYDGFVSPDETMYFTLFPQNNSVSGRFVNMEFTLSTTNTSITPQIGPNNMKINYESLVSEALDD